MERHERLPPRTLPIVYFAFAHVCLATAFGFIASHPAAVAGFFYHPKLIAVVHLVTLGWITSTILGATYVAGPLALRLPVGANRWDAVACGAYCVGVSGVVAHFFMGGYSGVAWSGVLILPAIACVAVRLWRALGVGGAPRPVKWHVGLAYFNLLLAALYGTLLAINRESTFLPGTQLENVVAHAHLAAVGWAMLMVAGVGYRLLAMLFPAAPPGDRPVWISLVLFETGVLGLAFCLASNSAWAPLFACVTVAAVLFFFSILVWMRRHPRPPPKKLRRPDFGVLHVLQGVGYLLVTAGVGLYLVFHPGWEPDWIFVYGVCGLVGFFAQVIIGVSMRLLPMFAWIEAWAGGGYEKLPPSPHVMPWRPLQAVSLGLWGAGVPLLAFGFAGGHEESLVAGGWVLFSGTLVNAANSAHVLRHAFRGPAG